MEIWKDIPDYEGYYQISDHGNVRSVDRYVNKRFYPSVIKSQTLDKDGYARVTLCKNNKKVRCKIYVTILLTFVGPKPEGYHGRHLDDDKTNNTLANLCWGTQSENELDKVRNGRNPMRNRTHCPRNHKLEEPNLVPACLNNSNHRWCLACSRVRFVKKTEEQIQIESDIRYEELMGIRGPVKEIDNKKKTECLFGHLLIGNNLAADELKRGKRKCRSCSNARSYMRLHSGYDLKELSDQYYVKHMQKEIT